MSLLTLRLLLVHLDLVKIIVGTTLGENLETRKIPLEEVVESVKEVGIWSVGPTVIIDNKLVMLRISGRGLIRWTTGDMVERMRSLMWILGALIRFC